MLDLTLEQKIGQMLCFGWSEETDEESKAYSACVRELVESMQVGGIVLMGRNVAPPYVQTAELLNQIQTASNLPLFVTVDQEGGPVARFTEPFTVFPSNMAFGATGSADYARRAAAATAQELKAIGVNFNFAPCVDVNSNPSNPIIGVRSYGESPDLVAELSAAAIKGYQNSGIIACAKHFPGHGDTSVDSHLQLPAVLHGKDRIESVELVPFRTAIHAGVDSIMITHIMFSAFDIERPATLSNRIITGLLRGQMGFSGVVITDCLEMKAISENYHPAEVGVLAVQAGADILLACHTLSYQREMREGLLRAVRDGQIPESRIDESVGRILALKEKYRLDERRTVDSGRVTESLGRAEHLELQREIAERSVTLVRDRDNILPLSLSRTDDLAVVGMHRSVEALTEAIWNYHPNARAVAVYKSDLEEAVASASRADVSVLVTCPQEPWTEHMNLEAQADMIRRVLASGVRVILVAVREPYGLGAFPEAGTCIATYGYGKASLEAAAKLLFGKIEPRCRLPVTIPPG
ncbi:MAG: beta-N-acetylhexosaminidase [Armatimonadetes bacterium]|nr:beta-N-acetylhexosaminidase [Armatimonadota bacterium]